MTPTEAFDLTLKTADGGTITNLEADDILICDITAQTLRVLRKNELLMWSYNGGTETQVHCKDIIHSVDALRVLLGISAALCGVRLVPQPVAPVGEVRFKVEA